MYEEEDIYSNESALSETFNAADLREQDSHVSKTRIIEEKITAGKIYENVESDETFVL